MITGTLTTDAHGQPATASVSTLLFDLPRIQVVANPHKAADHYPDHHLEFRTPRGRVLRVGSVWRAVSQRSGNAYLSLAFMSPLGSHHRANALPREGEAPGAYEVVALTGGETVAAVA